MNELTTGEQSPILPAEEWQSLQNLDTEALKERLKETLSMTAAQLLRLAAIVRILEERGEDLTDLKVGMLGYLRRIAHGQILPESVVRFGEYPSLVNRVGNLPIPEQRRLAQGDPVKLIVLRDQGPEYRLVDPLKLTGEQVTQVFARDHIRDESEQIQVLETRRNKPKKPRPRRRKVRADIERGGIRIGKSFASHDDVLQALAELNDSDYDDLVEGEGGTVPVKLTEAEHRQLKIKAARADTSMAHLARRALVAAGLIRGDVADWDEG